LLTFLAGAEIDPASLRKHKVPALAIGTVSCLFPFAGALPSRTIQRGAPVAPVYSTTIP
jgi:Kef-type K+ transport system membrane component KefB